MREYGLALAALLAAEPAFAQTPDANESGWFAEDPAAPDAAAPPEAPSAASPAPPAPTAATVLTPTSPRGDASTPELVLPPGQHAVVEPRCGRRAGSPLMVSCAESEAAVLDAGPEKTEPARRWYGWQTLVADLAIMGLFLGSIDDVDDQGAASGLYLGAAALTAPIIHLANQQPGKAGISFAIRGGGMLALGSMLSDGSTDWEDDETVTVLAALTLLLVHPAATALDAAVFARKPAPKARHASRGIRLVGGGPTVVRSDSLGRSSRMLPGAFVSAAF